LIESIDLTTNLSKSLHPKLSAKKLICRNEAGESEEMIRACAMNGAGPDEAEENYSQT
jgi:hypothetical protein